MNKCKITPTRSTLVKTHAGKDNDIVFQKLLLEFGLAGDRLVRSKKSVSKSLVRKVKDGSDVHSIMLQENWKTTKFNNFSTGKPYDIQTVLKK